MDAMEKVRKTFKAPWDGLLIVMTSGITVLLLGIDYYSSSMPPALITWSVILGALGFGIFGYRLEDGQLKIQRLGWSKDIDLSEVKNVEFKPQAMTGSVRTFGTGGLFCYVGYFRNSILKNYKAYVTHRNKTVVLTTNGGKIVVSPDNPQAFVASIKSIIGDKSTDD